MSSKKDIAITFLQMVSSGEVDDVYKKFIHPDFIHHNVYFKGDRESLRIGMKENAQEFPNKTYETIHALEDGDLVTVHGKVNLSDDMIFGVIHIFRFEGEKIIEVWEASQQELKDSPNENGLF